MKTFNLKKYHLLNLFILGFLCLNCNCLSAQKHIEYSIDIPQFSTLKVQDNVNVIYKTSPDSLARITFTAPQEFEDAFIFTSTPGTLKIQVTTEDVGKTDLPTLHVSSNMLSKVDNYSDFNVTVEDTGHVKKFEASLIGNGMINLNLVKADKISAKTTAGRGSIIIQGVCNSALFRVTGSGIINAENLTVENLECKYFGSGAIYCPASKKLVTKGVGSTKIYYRGNPILKHSGGGKLFPLN